MTDETPTGGSTCPNCGASVDDTYCSHCGQRQSEYPASVWKLAGEFLGEAVDLDSRIGRTVGPFFFRPGFLTAEFNAGRRRHYTSPLRIFLFMALLFFFLAAFRDPSPDLEVELERDDTGGLTFVLDRNAEGRAHGISLDARWLESSDGFLARRYTESLDRLQRLPPREAFRSFYHAAIDQATKVTVLGVPLFGIALWGLHAFRKRYYVEHLVFALHYTAFAFFVGSVVLIALHPYALAAGLLALPVYLAVALERAYDQGWPLAIAKTLALSIIGFVLLGTLTTLAALLAVTAG